LDFPFLSRGAGNQLVRLREDGLAVFEFGAAFSGRRKLLVLKLDHVGDFVIALPALEKLRDAFRGDHITLVCGPWNAAFAQASGIADEVRIFRFFPEDASNWDGQPVEGVDRFRAVAAGSFDIAIDLRVDEDTRFLLECVEAPLKCGIGGYGRHPFLDVLLPAVFERRENDPTRRLDPSRFQSRMPVQTPLFHETDFSTGGGHLVFGADLVLPAGRFRASWDVELRVPFRRFPGVKVTLDIARSSGQEIVASRVVNWARSGEFLGNTAVEFDNPVAGAAHEFRLHARGRPFRGRLRFYGVWVERLDHPEPPRFKPAELHIGEQLSLLVRLIEERCRPIEVGARLSDGTPSDWRKQFGLPSAAKAIVIAPISNSSLRDWGLANYASLARRLLDSVDCAVILVGSAIQRERLDRIVAELGSSDRVVNLAGRSDWPQTIAIIRQADLVISNNSGVGHLAAAAGAPTLTIYSGSHQPQEWGPRGPRSRAMMALIACSPCGWDRLEQCPNEFSCMRLVTPQAVAEEALEMLSRPREERGGRA
jgi:ADP-heptose:LPS heptosyltransferase